MRTIDIGKTERTIIVVPAQDPVPAKEPAEPDRAPRREREPDQVPTEK